MVAFEMLLSRSSKPRNISIRATDGIKTAVINKRVFCIGMKVGSCRVVDGSILPSFPRHWNDFSEGVLAPVGVFPCFFII